MIAGTLEVQLLANVARLQKDMNEAKGIVTNTMRDIDRAVGDLKSSLASMGVVLGVGFFAAIAKGAIDAQDHLNDLSKTTKIAASDLAGLSFAAKQNGADLNSSAASIDKLAVNMGKNAEKFKALGISTKDPLEAFAQFADVFRNVEDPQTRAALGAEVLGKKWEGAAPLLEEGGKKIRELVEQGKKLSGVTDESAKAADEFNDRLATLAGNGRMVNSIVGESLPILNQLLGDLIKLREEGEGTNAIATSIAEALRAIIIVGGNVSFVLQGIGRDLGAMGAQVVALVDTINAIKIGRLDLASEGLRQFKQIGDDVTAEAAARRQAFDEWEKGMLAVGTAASTAAKAVKGLTEEQYEEQRIATAAARDFLDGEERKKKAAKDALDAAKLAQKLRVDNAEAELKAQEMFAHDYAEAWKFADLERNREAKIASEERLMMAKAEIDAEEMFQKDFNDAWKYYSDYQVSEQKKAAKEFESSWGHVADVAGDFFADLVMNGKDAFDHLRDYTKRLLADMIALFAKRWILNLAAGGSVMGSAGNAAASMFGGDGGGGGIGGSLLSGLGSAATSYLLGTTGTTAATAVGAGAYTTTAVATYETAGVLAAGGTEAIMAGLYEALAAIPVWGWIAAAVIAVAAYFGGKGGGPKVGGSYMGGFDASGAGTAMSVPGSDNGRFFTPNQADNSVMQLVQSTAKGYYDIVQRLGGTGGNFGFGLGFDHDPNGTAQSRVSSMLTDASGKVIYRQQDMQMDDKAVPDALKLETQRMILAALQGSELPKEVADILNTLVAESATSDQIQKVLAAALEMKSVMDAIPNLGVKIDVEGIKAFAAEGESIGQTFNRLAQAVGTFDEQFMTDAQKIARATKQIEDAFKGLGIEVPKTKTEFYDLVHGLDLTTEAGRTMFTELMKIAPAFLLVANSVTEVADAAEQVMGFVYDYDGEMQRLADAWERGERAREARGNLGQYIDSLLLNPQLSPLSPEQQFAEAQRQYQTLLTSSQGGDLDATNRLAGASNEYLRLARALYASSPMYEAIFRSVVGEVGGLAGISQDELNSRLAGALPTSGTLMTEQAGARIENAVNSLIGLIANGITVNDPEAKAAIEDLKAELQGEGMVRQ